MKRGATCVAPLLFNPLLVLTYGERFACELLIQLKALRANVKIDLFP